MDDQPHVFNRQILQPRNEDVLIVNCALNVLKDPYRHDLVRFYLEELIPKYHDKKVF